MNEQQEKRIIIRAFNALTSRRTQGHLTMTQILYRVNGLQCALDFIAKMKEYEAAERAAK